jgi:hypothetical protein
MHLRGLNISITTTAKSDEEAKALLAGFQVPVQELRSASWQSFDHEARTQARKLVAKYAKKYANSRLSQ